MPAAELLCWNVHHARQLCARRGRAGETAVHRSLLNIWTTSACKRPQGRLFSLSRNTQRSIGLHRYGSQCCTSVGCSMLGEYGHKAPVHAHRPGMLQGWQDSAITKDRQCPMAVHRRAYLPCIGQCCNSQHGHCSAQRQSAGSRILGRQAQQ